MKEKTPLRDTRSRRIVPWLWLSTLVVFAVNVTGCVEYWPEFQVANVGLADDQLFVHVKTENRVERYHANINYENIRNYLLTFEIPANAAQARLSTFTAIPWSHEPHASYSSSRFLSIEGIFGDFDNKEWNVGLFSPKRSGEIETIRAWKSPHAAERFPPFITSNDGRYLALTERHGQLFDTSNLQCVDSGDFNRALEKALLGAAAFSRHIAMTNNLNFIIFEPRSGELRDQATADPIEEKLNSGKYWGFVSRSDNKVGVFPDQLRNPPSANTEVFQEAGESSKRELLLLYLGGTDRQLFCLLRDEQLNLRYKLSIPLTIRDDSGWQASWDPARHRVLLFKTPGYLHQSDPLRICIWDYESNAIHEFSINLEALFRLEGTKWVPLQAANSGG